MKRNWQNKNGVARSLGSQPWRKENGNQVWLCSHLMQTVEIDGGIMLLQ